MSKNYTSTSIKSWAVEDRPMEKLISRGSQALTDAELLAILIYHGTQQSSALDLAKELMVLVNYDLAKLSKLTMKELESIKGIGKTKAIRLMAAFELGERRQTNVLQHEIIHSSSSAAQILKLRLQRYQQEVFYVLYLNQANYIVHEQQISQGGINTTVVDVRLILRTAIQHLATGIIISHNHPSGNYLPSKADELLTQKVKSSAEIMDIRLLDHIIVSEQGYYSFADEGKL